MSTRRSFHAFLSNQRHRRGLVGQVIRELLATGRRFTPFKAFDWMITGTKGHSDDEYDALSELVATYENKRGAA